MSAEPLLKEAEYTAAGVNKFIDQHRVNTKSDLIEITEDKLENLLLKHLDKVTIKRSWITPVSIFISILLANITSNFTDRFGVKASTWDALYLLLSLASGIWSLAALFRSYTVKDKCTIPALIALIKNAEPPST